MEELKKIVAVRGRAKVQLVGIDGNAFSIMGIVKRGLRNQGWTQEEIDLYLKESMSGSYDRLLQIAMLVTE